MSVLQPISYGLVHQVGPGTGGRGFGSYKADNTELIVSRRLTNPAVAPVPAGEQLPNWKGIPDECC